MYLTSTGTAPPAAPAHQEPFVESYSFIGMSCDGLDIRSRDLLRAFNGRRGTEDAYQKGLMKHDDCCYPSAEGQQLIAELLTRTGLAPFE
jgi:hypothetical protein